MQQINRKNKLYILASVFTLLLFLSGCKTTELKTLESSTSVIQLTTGREVSRYSQDKDVVLGKPVYAQVRIEFEPINPYTNMDIFDEIVEILEKNNWERDNWIIAPDYFTAYLQQDYFRITASVLMHSNENLVTIFMEIH